MLNWQTAWPYGYINAIYGPIKDGISRLITNEPSKGQGCRNSIIDPRAKQCTGTATYTTSLTASHNIHRLAWGPLYSWVARGKDGSGKGTFSFVDNTFAISEK